MTTYNALTGKPVVKRKRGQPEMTQQEAVVRWIRQVIPGSMPQHIPNEMKARTTDFSAARFQQKRKKGGINPGFPDLTVPLPTPLYETVFIEMKVHDGTLSIEQQAVHAHLSQHGHKVGVATCIETARFLFHQWGIPLREPAGQPMRAAKFKLEKRGVELRDDAVPL